MSKIKLLIVGLIILNIILFTVVYLNRGGEVRPSPTSEPTVVKGLSVVSTAPALNLLSEVSSGTPIIVNFDTELDPSTIVIQTSPIIETSISVSSNTLTIKPTAYWLTDQEIKITILAAQGVNGELMKNPYEFVIKSPKPTF